MNFISRVHKAEDITGGAFNIGDGRGLAEHATELAEVVFGNHACLD